MSNATNPSDETALEAPAVAPQVEVDRRVVVEAELFRMLVDSVSDYAIFMLDPTGRVTTWNSGAERIKQYRADEIIGSHFSRFHPEIDIVAGKCEHELEVAGREGRFEEEGWRLRKDGSRFFASEVITAVRDAGGTLIGFAKVTRDLTDRMRVDEERAARAIAEHASRAKDEFLAMLGHELRNPMAPILTALQLMKLRGDDRSTKEQQVIERQVKHMMRLVDDLLDVSRITRGKVELKKRRIDVRDVIAKAVEVVSPVLEQRRHHLDVVVPPQPIVIDADEARLTQVFANLLSNAAKYTPPGGHVWVVIRPGAANQVEVEVRDDGSGIDAEQLPNIFDLFVQGHQSAERSSGGLGIGLALVRSLTDLHGGTVQARSAGAGTGSTFTVTLPVAEVSPVVETTARAPRLITAVGTPRRILLVDDNEDARTLLTEALRSVGHEVASAPGPVEALDVVHQFAPDVAILDIGLPVMDGYELAIRLCAKVPTAVPRLIALTGYGRDHDRERSRRAGFDVHLVKPVDVLHLLETIGQLASRSAPDE